MERGVWGWAGHPHSESAVAIPLENKVLAFIAFSRHSCVESAGLWMCSQYSCFAATAEVWTLASKPGEVVTCLPCLRAWGCYIYGPASHCFIGFSPNCSHLLGFYAPPPPH